MNAEQAIEQELGLTPIRSRPLSGGCIASARAIDTREGTTLFVKSMSRPFPFEVEARGLQWMAKATQGPRIPKVLLASPQFLILEYIPFVPEGVGFQEKLGRALAEMHQLQGPAYGFEADHVIGSTAQKNTPMRRPEELPWSSFWWEYRLDPLLQRLQDPELLRLGEQLASRLSGLIDGSGEYPAMLHGDLWSGNMASDPEGRPVLFDPAPYFGHPEAELGMTRMFGGFSPACYRAYEELHPLVDGWEERIDLYMLYHVLNHQLLFGSSYRSQAVAILKHFC